jgi:hypothetical protein
MPRTNWNSKITSSEANSRSGISPPFMKLKGYNVFKGAFKNNFSKAS